MAGIDTTSPHYKGKYASIYEVNKAYPSGGATGDYVDIQGFAHYWNADRNNWLVNQERDEYWDELLLAASAAVERIDKKLTDEITNRENSDEELWGAINNLPSYEDLLEADKQLSQRITAVENVVEEWPTDNISHTIMWGATDDIVSIGDVINWPAETVVWNPDIKAKDPEINYTKYLYCANGDIIHWGEQIKWSLADIGDNEFILSYSYPEGEVTLLSNLGRTKKQIIDGVIDKKLAKKVRCTLPWYINENRYLTAFGRTDVITIHLSGRPVVKVPFENSEVTIQADLGFGYMDVDWIKTIDNTNLGNAIDETVPYQVFTKPDSYTENIPHKITIKLIK